MRPHPPSRGPPPSDVQRGLYLEPLQDLEHGRAFGPLFSRSPHTVISPPAFQERGIIREEATTEGLDNSFVIGECLWLLSVRAEGR